MRKSTLFPLFLIISILLLSCSNQLIIEKKEKSVTFPGIPNSPIGHLYKVKFKPTSDNIKITGYLLDGKKFKVDCDYSPKKDEEFTFIAIKEVDGNQQKPDKYSAQIISNDQFKSCNVKRIESKKEMKPELVILYKRGSKKGRVEIEHFESVNKTYAP